MQQLAELYANRQRNELAQDYATRSHNIMHGSMGDQSPAAASTLASLASVEARGNHLNDSAQHFEKSTGLMKKFSLARDSTMAVILKRCAVVPKALHRNGEAKMALRDAKAILR